MESSYITSQHDARKWLTAGLTHRHGRFLPNHLPDYLRYRTVGEFGAGLKEHPASHKTTSCIVPTLLDRAVETYWD
jgi:hypothetical protein